MGMIDNLEDFLKQGRHIQALEDNTAALNSNSITMINHARSLNRMNTLTQQLVDAETNLATRITDLQNSATSLVTIAEKAIAVFLGAKTGDPITQEQVDALNVLYVKAGLVKDSMDAETAKATAALEPAPAPATEPAPAETTPAVESTSPEVPTAEVPPTEAAPA